VTSSVESGPGCPSTRTYWKPCVVSRGSKNVAFDARGHDDVDLAGAQRRGEERRVRAQVLHRHIAVGRQRLAVGEGDLRTLRSQRRQPDPAVDVLAEVDHVDTAPYLGHGDRAQLPDRSHRWSRRPDEGVVPELADDDVRPRWLGSQQPAVLVLTLDEVGLGDV
jgi:hypothetical protein